MPFMVTQIRRKMTNDTKQIHNVATGEIEIIELTDKEQATRNDEGQANRIAKLAEAQKKAEAKAAAQAKFEALGLTVEDLQALGL